MKPSVQKIFTKLAKEQKVELSLINDIMQANVKAVKEYEDSIKFLFKIMADVDRAILTAETAVKLAEKTMPKVKEFDRLRKEIGVAPDAKMNKAAQSIYDIAEGGGKAHLKTLQKIKSSI